LILGEGSCRSAIEQQARDLGIENRLFLHGFVSDPRAYYEHADLHLLSSIAEGFGNVIVEALAAGTPVVSTDCPSGPREILCDGQFGKLVPVGDVDAMAQAIVAALTESHDHDALKARAQDFSIVKTTDQYEALLLGSNI
jgi:glycosyltransferase involved in cell wall biosynthesis